MRVVGEAGGPGARDLPARAAVRPHDAPDPVEAVLRARAEGTGLLLATGGTSTGVPREVRRTTESWWRSFAPYSELTGLAAGDRLWVPGPLTATMNLFAAVHARWAGVALVGSPGDATHACLTPARLDQRLDDLRPGTTVVVAGAAVPGALSRRAAERGVVVEHYYGAAELSFVGWGTGGGDLAPFPGVEVETRDHPVARTLWVRSPYLCDGYSGPPGSLRTDADGWASVGDLGVVSAGRLAVLGRPDAIVTAGATVLVADVEEALGTVAHGAFVVHAVPHARLGQVVAVTFVDPADRARLERHARDHLPVAHRPRVWRAVDALPLTAAGKVDRFRLEEGHA